MFQGPPVIGPLYGKFPMPFPNPTAILSLKISEACMENLPYRGPLSFGVPGITLDATKTLNQVDDARQQVETPWSWCGFFSMLSKTPV